MDSINRSLGSLVHCGMHEGLAERIRHYFEYCWVRHRDFAAQSLVAELPTVFKRRVALQVLPAPTLHSAHTPHPTPTPPHPPLHG
jgi:hypothetical protein